MVGRRGAGLAGVVALALVVSLVGCGPSSSSEAASTARAEPTGGATQATPIATPTVREEVIDRHSRGTACAPELDRPRWLFREFVRWTPDGLTVLFTDGPRIYAVAADGSRLWQVVAPAQVRGYDLGTMAAFTLAPDGEQIVYATCDYPGPQAKALGAGDADGLEKEGYGYELARVYVDGTQQQRLTVNELFDNHPAWSPDGTRIAFLSDDYDDRSGYFPSAITPRLYTMAPDGSDVAEVPIGVVGGEPVHLPPQWSPDGRRLAFLGRATERPENRERQPSTASVPMVPTSGD